MGEGRLRRQKRHVLPRDQGGLHRVAGLRQMRLLDIQALCLFRENMVKSICLVLCQRFQVDFSLNSLNSYVFLATLFKRRMTIE